MACWSACCCCNTPLKHTALSFFFLFLTIVDVKFQIIIICDLEFMQKTTFTFVVYNTIKERERGSTWSRLPRLETCLLLFKEIGTVNIYM